MRPLTLRVVFFVSLCVPFLSLSPSVFAQTISVTSANPNNAPQGTLNLNVAIGGSGFKKGAHAVFYRSGSTTDTGGVTVNSTAFGGSNQVTASINVSNTATITSFDVVVTNTDGRSGKGTQLFSVTPMIKGTNCTFPTAKLAAPVNCYLSSGGCLDNTFGAPNGYVLTDTDGLSAGSDMEKSEDIVIQSDGKIVSVGETTGSSQGIAFVRYNIDGSLDTTFGSNGTGIVKVTPPGNQTINSAALQPDGKILAAGWTSFPYPNSSTLFLVVRINPDGSLDATFGTGGIVQIATSTTTRKVQGQLVTTTSGKANGLAVLSNGQIIAAGLAVVRLNPDGSLDTSFGTNGQFNDGYYAYGLALQPIQVGTATEEFIVLGRAAQAPTGTNGTDFELVRLTPSGSVDTSFGPSGTGAVYTDFCGNTDILGSLAVDSAGRIIAGGLATAPITPSTNLGVSAITRYSANGILDTTFGDSSAGPGKSIVLALPGGSGGNRIVPQTDGKIVMTAGCDDNPESGNFQFCVVRFTADGWPDDTFGTGSVVVPYFGPTGGIAGKGTIDGNGKILMGGAVDANGTYNTTVVRFWP